MNLPEWNFWTILLSTLFLLFDLFLIYGIIQSIGEKEKKAALRMSLSLITVLILESIVFVLGSNISSLLYWVVIDVAISISVLLVLFPWPDKKIDLKIGEPGQIDERTIMFSRNELDLGSERYDKYYKMYPNHKESDDDFRESPGLMDEKSQFYHPWIFPAADASFYTVDALKSRTDGKVSANRQEVDPEKLTRFVKKWAEEMGCHSIGVTTLKKSHLYTVGGRSHNYNEPVENDHPLAIAFTVEMDFDRVATSPRGPIIMESSYQYLQTGIIAVQLAAFLRNIGYSSKAHIDGKYQVRCPQLARDAGLGEIGRMGILMTPKLGPRIRIGVVTTEAPLALNEKVGDSSMLKFCTICKKCADACPSQAISSGARKLTNKSLVWTTNQEKCFSYWCKVGTDCGRCLAVCPYSHPDNTFHNLVRLFIRRSPVFRVLAYKLDDFLYGRKPPSRELPDWMNPKI